MVKHSQLVICVWLIAIIVFPETLAKSANAQEQKPQILTRGNAALIPPVIEFTAFLKQFNGARRTSLTGVTFSIYKEAEGGSPIWIETQNVQPDATGKFTVFLGDMHPGGLPPDIFSAGDARWVEMTSPGLPTPDRIALVSVPYALKAGDADTLGGRPLSDFVLRNNRNAPCHTCSQGLSIPISLPGLASNHAPQFVSTASSGPSFVSQAKQGAPFQVQSAELVPNLNSDLLHGLPDTSFAKLASDNSFAATQRFAAGFILPAVNAEANSPTILDSASEDFETSAPDPNTGVVVKRIFRWFSRAANSGTTNSPAQLTLAFGVNGASPSPTGLSINADGSINFSPNQQFPTAAVAAAMNGNATTSDPGNAPIVYTSGYQWQQQSGATSGSAQSIAVGWNSITLSPCPGGVNGSDNWHYLYISGTGTPEIVLISGGSCVSGAKSGTIQFIAAYAHPIGYTIGSATAGLQEAINAAILPNSNGQARSVLINPGQYTLMARLSIRASGIHITGYGATVTCAVADTCILLGDPSSSNAFLRISLEGISVRPGIQNGTFSAIEDNANGSQLISISPAQATNRSFTFGHIIQVDNDQAASMDRIDTAATGTIRCDQDFCGSVIYAPGPFAINAAVGWLTNSNLSPQCGANGVDWQSGNTLQIENTVIQGYAQFGIRAGTARGGYGNLLMQNVYEEVGSCHNPAGNIGHAGVIAQGGTLRITGGMGPAGELPCFSTSCSGQLTRYYIVARNQKYGSSNLLGAGVTPMTDSSTKVSWPEIAGATSYDLLAEDNNASWNSGSSPSGSGGFAVAINIPPSNCSHGVCTFVDMHSQRLNYAVTAPTYFPLLTYWPGPVVLGSGGDNSSPYSPSMLYTDLAPYGIVAEQGTSRVAVIAQSCDSQSAASPAWVQCEGSIAPPSNLYQQQATIMLVKANQDGNLATNMKGRLNFGTLGSGPSHIITLSDSNFQKTIASADNRPSNDPTDAFIGYDQGNGDPSNIGISFGAPRSLSNYIGNVGDGAHWLERLTTSAKTFRVPLQTTAVLFSMLPACNTGTEGSMRAVLDASTSTWGATIGGGGSNHALAYCDGTDWTVAAK